jgi:hypothetical protein
MFCSAMAFVGTAHEFGASLASREAVEYGLFVNEGVQLGLG